VILDGFITKSIAELDKHTKKSKELEEKTSELDAREKQLDNLHAETIRKLENQNFKLKNENEHLKKQVALLKKKKGRRPREKQHKQNMAAFARQQQTVNLTAIKPKKTPTHKRRRN
jgi:hypothetical protein